MENKENYVKDLETIRTLMERSTRFLSLSGLSGIMAGIYAIIGAGAFYLRYSEFISGSTGYETWPDDFVHFMLVDGISVLVLSLGTAVFHSYRKARKHGNKIWDQAARRLLLNLMIPLVAGGLLTMLFIVRYQYHYIFSFTMIFYGLALINASKYSWDDLRSMGITIVAAGLIAAYLAGNWLAGLVLWTTAFGLLHIIYGYTMYSKYDK